MLELLNSLATTPVPTLLVVIGAIFLFFVFFDVTFEKFSLQRREHTKSSSMVLGFIGSLMILVGIAIYASPAVGFQSPQVTPAPTETAAVVAETPTTAPLVPTETQTSINPTMMTDSFEAFGQAQITVGKTQYRNGPGYAYDVLGELSLGDLVDVLGAGNDDTWYQIITDNEAVGWVPARDLNAESLDAQIPLITDVPTASAPTTIPRIISINLPPSVGSEGASGTIVFDDLDSDVQTARLTVVDGSFEDFDVDILAGSNFSEFMIAPCGAQLVTLSIQLFDAERNSSVPVYFSFACRQ